MTYARVLCIFSSFLCIFSSKRTETFQKVVYLVEKQRGTKYSFFSKKIIEPCIYKKLFVSLQPNWIFTYMNVTHEELVKALQTYFGFDTFKGNQEAIIRNVMEGKDTFVLMPTGGGKSLCFQLPSLIMEGVAIVISPLIALMKNQVDAMSNYSEEEGVAHFINSSLTRGEINAVKEDVLAGKTKLLYLAPESLQKAENV